MAEEFKAMIGRKFTPLTILENTSTVVDINNVISTFNTAIIETSNEVLGQHCSKMKPWITTDILDLCDERRKWKKHKGDVEGVKQYRKITNKVKKMRQARKDWIEDQCKDIEEGLHRNQTRGAYETVRKLTNAKQRQVCGINDKKWEVFNQSRRYYMALNTEQSFLAIIQKGTQQYSQTATPINDNLAILQVEIEVAVKALKWKISWS